MTGRALAVVIWLLTIFSVGLFFMGWWFPPAITEHGPAYDQQFLLTIIVVGISFVLAQVGLGYMVWRYRDTGQGERALYSHGSNKLEMIWTVVTAIIFISLAVLGQKVWAQLHFQPRPQARPASTSSRSSSSGTFITRALIKSSATRTRSL